MRQSTRTALALVSVAAVASVAVVFGAALQRSPAAPPPASRVRVWQDTVTLPTYEEGLPDPNPPFDLFVTTRFNYPYTLRQNLTDRRTLRPWRALHLENEYLHCVVLPDLGGHLYRCIDKLNGADLFYANPSIKLARIAYRGAWAALGIEFNFPVSHNWMTTSPVDFASVAHPDGHGSLWVGNIDRAYGMQWRVELVLRPGRAVLEQHTWLYNRNDTRRRFYWWTNAAVEVKDDSRILYPMQFTAAHGFADIDTWPVNGAGLDLSVVGNHTAGPVSRFAHGSREPFMAVYHPWSDSGVVHYSSPLDLPAKKIWSWGCDADGLDWRRALSDNNSAYVEVQAGLFRNQETYAFLEPQQSIHFTEYWIPIRKLGGLTRANADAALHVARQGDTGGVRVALNVTRPIRGATLRVSQGSHTLSTETLDLTPSAVVTRSLAASPEPVTVSVDDRSGRVVIEHTEGAYDYLPRSEVKTGAQVSPTYPAPGERTDTDIAALGRNQELDGQLLVAMETYREGLRRFPHSSALNRAAGRLAVTLKQYDLADTCLSAVLARSTTDYDAAYYLALALIDRESMRPLPSVRHAHASALPLTTSSPALARARLLLESVHQFGLYRPAATLALAALESRAGRHQAALALLDDASLERPDAIRAAGMTVSLLRAAGRVREARARAAALQQRDPSNGFLRYEATLLGHADPDLWQHLAGDPERILEIAADYMRFGLFTDALGILSRSFPSAGVVSEPGMPHADSYPLIAYYRARCRAALGQDPTADLRAASQMPTVYVFPNRPDTFGVLNEAVARNPKDATAHFLLGSLYLSGGMVTQAMDAWEKARALNSRIPTLHRNMGTTLMQTGGSLDCAIELLQEGTRMDPANVGLYVTLEQALTRAGRPAAERAEAILSFPDQQALPTPLVFRLASALGEAGRFDAAEAQLRGRFFAREEGGTNVRQVYLEIRARRAAALAEQGDCTQARAIVDTLTRPAADLPFTRDGLEPFVGRGLVAELVARVKDKCKAGL